MFRNRRDILKGATPPAETGRAQDGITGLESRDFFANNFHHAGRVDPEYLGPGLHHLSVIQILPVERVEGNGAVADANLVGARGRVDSVDELEGTAFLGCHILFHDPVGVG